MPSAIWTGTISFGLVTVPVRAVSATRSRDVRFNPLEESTGARIRYRKVSEQTGDEVPSEKIVAASAAGLLNDSPARRRSPTKDQRSKTHPSPAWPYHSRLFFP